MIVGKKWFYIILSSLFVLLVVINLALWTTERGFGADMTSNIFGSTNGSRPSNYIGFHSLFEILSTFPGPSISIEVLNDWCNVFTNFEVTGIVAVDWFIALFRLITGPIVTGVAIIGDILSNLLWLFNVVFLQGFESLFTHRDSMYYMPLN